MDIVDYGNNNGGSRLLVVTELGHIKQLVTQLEAHLAESPDLCKRLASQIFSLTERSIGIITSSSSSGAFRGAGRKKRCAPATPSCSPIGDVVVDAPFKKRKMINKKSTHQVRVSSCGGETRTAVDDGHSWRKYGQKEILGAKHPRGYYRCTHRHSQGCAATKQVQRTDEDPTLFDVIYVGTHTCVNRTAAVAAAGGQATQPPDAHVDLLQNLSGNLTVKTEGPAAVAAEPQGRSADATPFCFPSTPAGGGLAPERSPFPVPSTTSGDWGVSPATSDSNHVASFPPFGGAAGDAEWWAQSELQEVLSALVAAGTAPEPALHIDDDDDDFIDIDISSFFV